MKSAMLLEKRTNADADADGALQNDRSDLTMKWLRSTFSDWAAESTSDPREVCEQALAHNRQDKAEAAYFRTDLFEKRRAMMEEWAEYARSMKADKKQISGP